MSAGKKKGRTVGSGTTQSAGEKESRYVNDNDSTIEELSLRVAAVERRYFSDPRIENYFCDHARACAAAGRRFSTYERAEWLRWFRPSDSSGRDIEVDNTDIPIVARLTVERVPECKPYIELRRSKYDAVFAERAAVRADNGA